MRKLLLTLSLVVLSCVSMLAQTKAITGVVTGDDGLPVPGATIMVKGTSIGTVADMDGKYSLNVPADAIAIVCRFIGMQDQELEIAGQTTINVTLSSDAKAIDEVVVTAMGISRAEKTLGYSAASVKSDEIVKARTTNVADALSGKVAGVTVNATSSDPGSVSNVVIRGFSSINGSNQPLYVVDGVPLQNSMASSSGKNIATGGIANISSEDIEAMTVLKGAAATAIYGSRAANGVIIITTKSGKKAESRNFSIEYSGSVQARQVAVLPKFQNKFGQGWNGTQTFIENGSWGSEFDGSTQVYGPIWNHQQRIHKYNAVEDNVKEFFDLGWSHNQSIALSGVSDSGDMTYYLSYSYAYDNGIMPTDADLYKRNTIAFRSTYDAAKWLKLSASANIARSKTDAVGSFQGTSVIDGLYEFPRDISLVDLKDTSIAFNTPEAYLTPYGITNPYWALENNYNHTDSKQVYGKVQADIKPMDGLTLTYRYGFDYTDYDRKVGSPEIALDDALIDDDMGYAPSNMNQEGYVYTSYNRRYEMNHDFLVNYNNKFIDNKLDVALVAGVNMNERYSTASAGETDKLTFYTGFWDLSNGATKKVIEESQSKRRAVGLFGDLTIGWDDMVYLDVTARNDWSSTLPLKENSFFYPGATLSWIFTHVVPENDALSFGKVRLAFGKTGNDADPYKTSSSYIQSDSYLRYGDGVKFPMNGINSFRKSATVGSATLRPEMTKEFEIGLNLKFFNDRFGIDAAYYKRNTDDQIFELPVDPATGYTRMVTNFGEVENKGIELVLNTTPIRMKNIQWDIEFNFSKIKNKVISLPEGLEGGRVSIYSFSAGNDAVQMYAETGKPMGQFYSQLPSYTEDGKLIVDQNGMPIIDTDVNDTGKNMNNDWTGGINTSLRVFDFTLSAQLDVRYGGYMFSRTKNLMQFTGNGDITTYNDRRPFVIPNSVCIDAEGNVSENSTPIYLSNSSYQDYYDKCGWGQGGEAYLVDRSFAKLRNVSLSYSLPRSIVNAISLRDISLTVFCNNVYTWTAKSNTFIDPENTTVSQASYGDLATQFGELYANPSCRTYGLNLNVKF
ncbi:MAG: SusC/RagA family TonB-linked outer membrane protein [Bacteroidales bacterium]|nr:SusC/RagA family TonB-linked outer membrane protein [Bacteroidales bacterium]